MSRYRRGREVSLPPAAQWWGQGEIFFAGALDRLSEEDLAGPSLLPGWSRATVVAHVARNADALVNLLTWARTGTETPMYASSQARDDAIAATAAQPATELIADYHAARTRLDAAVHSLPEPAWTREVRTAQGRTVEASEVAWMRCREVWVHAVDLDAGLGFADIPDDILTALVEDITRTWQRRGEAPEIRFSSGAREWGGGDVTVSASLPDLAAWISGRADSERLDFDGPLPTLPTWL